MFQNSKSEVEDSGSHDDAHGLEFHPHYTETEHGKEHQTHNGNASEIPRTMSNSSPTSFVRSLHLLSLSDIDEEYGTSEYTWAPVLPTDQVEAAESKISRPSAQVKTPGGTAYSVSSQNLGLYPFSSQDRRLASSQSYSVFSCNTPLYRKYATEPNIDRNSSPLNPTSNTESAICNPESEQTSIRNAIKDLNAIHGLTSPFRNFQIDDYPDLKATSPISEERGSSGGDGRVYDVDALQSLKVTRKEGQKGTAENSMDEDLPQPESCAGRQEPPRIQAVDTVIGAGSWILEEGGALSALDPELIFEIVSDIRGGNEETFQNYQGWRSCPRNHTGQSSGKKSGSENNTSSNRRSSSESTGPGSEPSKGDGPSQKRSYRGQRNPSDGDGDGDDNGDQDQDQFKKPKIEKSPKRRFACPFWKKDPQFYKTSAENGKKYMACAAGMGFTDIARLKEHLNRVHLLPITCSRCGLNFEKKKELDNHTRDIERNGCKVMPQKLQKGITPDIQEKLKKRSKDGKHPSDEEKWFGIYHLLFPDSPDPASGPYREILNSASPAFDRNEPFLDFADRELPRILERRFEAGLLDFCPDPESRAQLKQFIFSEIHFGMEQLSAPSPETDLPAEDFNQLRHIPSVGSYADSGYASLPRCSSRDCEGGCMLCTSPAPSPMSARKCGNSHCFGCIHCVDMATPSSEPLPSSLPLGASFSQHVADGCIDPSMLSNSVGSLSSTTAMDYFLKSQFQKDQ